MKSKKGVSGVVTTVIMIALVMGAVAVVWNVVNNLIGEKLEETESCFGNFGKVTINSRYTCLNTTSNKFQFSISIADVEVDGILVSISGEGQTQSFELTKGESQIDYLTNYLAGTPEIKAPGKNSGKTYLFDLTAAGFGSQIDVFTIAPIINGKQCEVSDSLSEIDPCSAFG